MDDASFRLLCASYIFFCLTEACSVSQVLYHKKCIPSCIRALYDVNRKIIGPVQMISRSVLLAQKSQSVDKQRRNLR